MTPHPYTICIFSVLTYLLKVLRTLPSAQWWTCRFLYHFRRLKPAHASKLWKAMSRNENSHSKHHRSLQNTKLHFQRFKISMIYRLRSLVTWAAILFTLLLVLPTNLPPRSLFFAGVCNDKEVVISLATVAQRLEYPFPTALRTLMRQTASACTTIWVFVPTQDRQAAENIAHRLDKVAAAAGKLVYMYFVDDRVSANKFLYSLEALAHPDSVENSNESFGEHYWQHGLWRTSSRFYRDGISWRPSAEDTLILGLEPNAPHLTTEQLQAEVHRLRMANAMLFICDDDWVHHHRLVETLLLGYHRIKTLHSGAEIAVGTRGYRVKPDYTWGVEPEEIQHHVVEGWQITREYQTGIATSGKGILFDPKAALGRFNLSDYGNAPAGAHFVDDIWLNGHLTAANISRWILPLPSSPGGMQINGDSPLDRRLKGEGIGRWTANTDTIKYFSQYWEDSILYKRGGEGGPEYRLLPSRWLLELRGAFTLHVLVKAGLI